MSIVKEKRKEAYDKNINPRNYVKGGNVLVRKETGPNLSALFDGPYEVVGINGSNVYIRKEVVIDEIHKDRI